MTNTENASSEFNKHIKDVGKAVEHTGGGNGDLAAQAGAYMKDANQRVSELASQAGDYYQQGQRVAVDAARAQPLAAIGVAGLVGFVLGLLLAR
jgi:ElaB/YqjD/DUF883 family membrane-anchored ribosome-binding protein